MTLRIQDREKADSFVQGRLLLLVAFILAMAVGYGAFRYFYLVGAEHPFAQELLLVFLGAIATVLITAFLLNQQTALELKKEGKVLLIDQKNSVYMAAIEKIAELVEKRKFDADIVDELRVENHKLAIVGSRTVIVAFNEVLKRILAGLSDGALSEQQAEEVMHSVARLTFEMRRDLIDETEEGDGATVLQAILQNSRRVESIDDIGDERQRP